MKYFILLVTVFFISGCETFAGFVRSSTVDVNPPVDCVVRTLKSMDGVTNISYDREVIDVSINEVSSKGNTKLTKQQNTSNLYSFLYHDMKSHFSFFESFNGKVYFYRGHSYVRGYPSQKEVDTMYRFFITLEKELKASCDINETESGVTESCNSVCPDI